LYNLSTGVTDVEACRSFERTCNFTLLKDKLARKKPCKVSDLVNIVTTYADNDRRKGDDSEYKNKSSGNQPKSNKRKGDDSSELVANANRNGGGKDFKKSRPKTEYTTEVAESQPCKIHSKPQKMADHLLKDCLLWKNRPAATKTAKGKDEDDNELE